MLRYLLASIKQSSKAQNGGETKRPPLASTEPKVKQTPADAA